MIYAFKLNFLFTTCGMVRDNDNNCNIKQISSCLINPDGFEIYKTQNYLHVHNVLGVDFPWVACPNVTMCLLEVAVTSFTVIQGRFSKRR